MSSKLEARVAQHDREIAAIRKLLSRGARMLIRLEAGVVRLEAAQMRTAAAQTRTEQTLERLMRSLERATTNGHSKRPGRGGGKIQ